MPLFEVEWTEKIYFKKQVYAMDASGAEELALANVEIDDETGKTETDIQETKELKPGE